MRIHVGANWQGYTAARRLETELAAQGHQILWWGATELDEGDDYPVFAIRVGKAVVADEDTGEPGVGLILGGDGAGEVIAANKVKGARAVPGLSTHFIRCARQHADANVLVLPCALLSAQQQDEAIQVFLHTEFLAELDDARRLVNTAEFESWGTIEGWTVQPVEEKTP